MSVFLFIITCLLWFSAGFVSTSLCTNLSGKDIKVTWDSEMQDTTITNGQTKILRVNVDGDVDAL